MYPGQGTFVSFAEKIVGTFEKLVPDPAIQKVKIRLRGICGAIPFNTDISELRPKRTCEPFAPTRDNIYILSMLLQHMHNT